MTSNLDRLVELSEDARMSAADMEAAVAGERAAKVHLLELLVAAVRPSLPTIASRVPAYASGKASEYGRRTSRWLEAPHERAVLVAGSERPDVPARRIEGVEPLVGSALYLSEQGEFFAVQFSGLFRNSESASIDDYWWEATPTTLSPERVVLERWPVGRIAEVLALELEGQVLGKRKATEKARRVAAAVGACASLLKGVR